MLERIWERIRQRPVNSLLAGCSWLGVGLLVAAWLGSGGSDKRALAAWGAALAVFGLVGGLMLATIDASRRRRRPKP
ncbi:MAG TPA: hypothetical protein VMI11_01065 [Actinomycetes bacterium]|nr:hypothetical protein [Actinomycetes bacterium]